MKMVIAKFKAILEYFMDFDSDDEAFEVF